MHWWRRWKPAMQFTTAAALVLAIGLNADSLVESIRRRLPHEGWTRFRPPHETAALLVEGTKLWAGGRDGLSLFDWERGTLLEPPKSTPSLERIRSLRLDRKGVLWVGHGNGVERREGGVWSHMDAKVGAVEAVLERKNGEIWAGGEKGLARLESGSFRMVRDSAALGFDGVFALLEDRTGTLWVGSVNPVHGGLGRLTAEGVWQDFSHNPGLAHPSVSAIFEDREGGLWFSSGFGKRGGACRMKDEQWKCLGKKDGLTADRTRIVYEDSGGRFWIGSETEGMAMQSGAGWKILTPDQGMTGWEIKCIRETPDGVFWFGTEDGVTMIRPDAPELRKGTAR